LPDQIVFLNQAVCLQNWDNALTLINRIIASEALPAEDRNFYVNYRRTLLDYRERKPSLDTQPGCEDVFSEMEAIQKTEEPVSQHSSNPTFNWDQEIANMTNRIPASLNMPLPVSQSSTVGTTVANSSRLSPEIVFQDNQGIFFRPAPSSNIPSGRIQGSVVSYLPMEAQDIVVHYDVYSRSTNDGPNASSIYTCYQREQYEWIADQIPAQAQRGVLIEEPDRFVQVVGITWQENGKSAFVRVSEFKNTGNVQPCSRWYPYYYYNSFDRQAVDPQIRLR